MPHLGPPHSSRPPPAHTPASITNPPGADRRRLYVEESVYDQVVEGVAEAARNIKVGNGLDPTTDMGSLVSQEQFDRVTGYIDSGRGDGANIMGGQRVGERGYCVGPTILTRTREDMKARPRGDLRTGRRDPNPRR